MGHSSSQYLNLKPGMGTDFSVPMPGFSVITPVCHCLHLARSIIRNTAGTGASRPSLILPPPISDVIVNTRKGVFVNYAPAEIAG